MAARLDTGYSVRIDNYGCLDLTFASEGAFANVPFVLVQGTMLFMRQGSAFVWPRWLPPMRKDLTRAIEAALEPWLRSLTIGRFLNGEVVRYFGDDVEAHRAFERARSLGFLGAAPTEDVMRDVAPYVYALRFAQGARVAVRDPRGASGAALLARAGAVDARLGDAAAEEAARRWFGLEIFGGAEADSYELAVGERARLPRANVGIAVDGAGEGERAVPVAAPVPIAIMVSFDLEDAAEVGRFGVRAPEMQARPDRTEPVRVVGGSSGRIGIVLRDDYASSPDADGDAAAALAQRLNAQGFDARLVGASHVRASSFDLLHVFGTECAAALAGSFEREPQGPVPIVLTAYADDPKDEAAWGNAVHREAISNAIDETMRSEYALAVSRRLLTAPGAPAIGASPMKEPEVAALLARVKAAIVAAPDEERRLRESFGWSGASRVVPALLGEHAGASGRASELAGMGEFVLAHGPIDPRCNQYLLAEACGKLGYPLILTGPVGNVEYYGEVLARLGDGGCWIPAAALSPEDLSGLYRRARVFADVGWSGRGLYRLARAGAGGAALVASSAGYARSAWPGLVQTVDPGTLESVLEGVKAAWERAPELGPATALRTADQYAPFPMLVAVLAAYQQAAAI